jgi:hypothetical protein
MPQKIDYDHYPTRKILREIASEIHHISPKTKLEDVLAAHGSFGWFCATLMDISNALLKGQNPQHSLQLLWDALNNNPPLSQATLQNLGAYWQSLTPKTSDFAPVEAWLKAQTFRAALRTAKLCIDVLQDISYAEPGNEWNAVAELVDAADHALTAIDRLKGGRDLHDVTDAINKARFRLNDAQTYLQRQQAQSNPQTTA